MAVLTSLFWLPFFLMIPVLVLATAGGNYLVDPLARWWGASRAARAIDRWWRGR
jgi:hypothetical protein